MSSKRQAIQRLAHDGPHQVIQTTHSYSSKCQTPEESQPAPGHERMASSGRPNGEGGVYCGEGCLNHCSAPIWSGRGVMIAVLQGDDETVLRQCYEGVERDGEVIRVRDTVLLRSGPRKKSLPYVAKISALWEDPRTGGVKHKSRDCRA